MTQRMGALRMRWTEESERFGYSPRELIVYKDVSEKLNMTLVRRGDMSVFTRKRGERVEKEPSIGKW